MTRIRVHSIPHSTNVERVALACGIKGIAIDWVEHDPADRAGLVELSGQELVPVAEIGSAVVADSMRIVERLEQIAPAPRLYPDRPAERAAVEAFVDWFDEVWKGPPNALDADQPPADQESLRRRVRTWIDRFELHLDRSDYLFDSAPSAADVCAYPFLRYAVDAPDPADDQRFHRILHELLSPGAHPRLDRWVERVAAIPQA